MRTARFSLLTSAAMALALAVSSNSLAQSAPPAEAASVPTPDTSLPAPLTAKDVAPAATTASAPAANPAPAPTAEAKPAAAAPAPAASAPAAAPTLASADNAIADKLREMANGKFDRILGKKERTQIEAFYSGREFAPLFTTSNGLSERGKAAVAYLSGVDADGLEPADYPVPEVKAGADAEAMAEAELKLVQSLLTYARHAQTGRIHFSRIAADIFYELNRPEPADVLAKIANASSLGTALALDTFEPSHPQYKALKAKLAEVRSGKGEVGVVRIASGPVLKYAKDKKGKETIMEDARVPQLRERLGLSAEDNTNYDKALADAVAKFQKEHALPSNGQLTATTVDTMNGPKRDRDADTIIVNMERWRWMPRDLGKTYVMVNIPEFQLRLFRDEKLYWNTRVVVGKPTQPTPIMSAEMKFITVNPTWNVPPSIIQNEYLPALREDPNAMERIGLKVQQNPDGTVRIWQPPGERNALGRIRFNFPNKFLVYQHDTPDKNLFAHEKRAYSHGCMRVQDPLMYGEKLLSIALPQENYSAERLRKMFGGAEVNINFPKFIPVHLTYQTAFVDDSGKLRVLEDVYGRDKRMMDQLKGSDRKVADIAMDRPKSTPTAPVRAAPGTFGGPTASNTGFSFFDRLFGAPAAAPTEKPAKPRSRAARANTPTDFR
ncbi:MAG: L,D-transpeptidase family protein [Pseudomonadota bacterium]